MLTITAVVGAVMMNCTDRLSCDKCQIHFYNDSPGRVEHFDINAAIPLGVECATLTCCSS